MNSGVIRRILLLSITILITFPDEAQAYELPRCEIIPLPNHQTSFRIDGLEVTRWNFSQNSRRPFFFPLIGPSGTPLTRLGHPGAPDHDHHKSVWFAHHKVDGFDFWSDTSGTHIRQEQWLAYQDGQDQAVMVIRLGWYSPEGKRVMQTDLTAALLAMPHNEFQLELQLALMPPKKTAPVILEMTHFGIVAVRVAKSISAHFGGGRLTNDQGMTGEADLFGKASSFVDYSGPIAKRTPPSRVITTEGITLFDHPSNPSFPSKWHVRDDGWMGPSICRDNAIEIRRDSPLTLRYLLHIHRGAFSLEAARVIADDFESRPAFETVKSSNPHHHYDVRRLKTNVEPAS